MRKTDNASGPTRSRLKRAEMPVPVRGTRMGGQSRRMNGSAVGSKSGAGDPFGPEKSSSLFGLLILNECIHAGDILGHAPAEYKS